METPKQENVPSPRSKLENMSHEDLVKVNKKQMIFLQKLKAKCDDLQTKLSAQSDYDQVKGQLVIAEEKSSKLQEEFERVKQNETDLLRSNNATKEELECLKQKQGTLLSSLQRLQDDFNGSVTEKKSLEEKIAIFEQDKKNAAYKLNDFENELQDVKDQLEDKNMQLHALKDHIKTLQGSEETAKQICAKLEQENTEAKNELSALKITLDLFKKSSKTAEKEDKKVEELQDKLKNLSLKSKAFQDENKSLLEKINELECLKKDCLSKLDAATEQHSQLTDKLAQSKFHQTSLQKQLLQKQQEFETEISHLKDHFEKEKAEKDQAHTTKAIEQNSSLNATLQELNNMKVENTKLEDVVSNLQISLSELDAENNKLNEKVQDLSESLFQAEKKSENSLHQLHEQQKLYAESSSNFNTEKEVLEQNLEQKIAEITEKAQKTDTEFSDATNKLSAQLKENVELNTQLDELKEEIKSQNKKIAELCNELQAKDTQLTTMQSSLQSTGDTKIAMEEIQANYNVVITECNQLKQSLNESKEGEAISVEKALQLEKNADELNGKIQEMQMKNDKLQQDLSNEIESCKVLKESNLQLSGKVKELQETVIVFTDKLDEANNSRSEVQTELASKLEKVQSDLKLLEEENGTKEKKLKSKIEELQINVDEKQDKLASTEEELQLLQNQIEKFQVEKVHNSTNIQTNNKKLQEMETQNKILQEECDKLNQKMQELIDSKESHLRSVETEVQASNLKLASEIEQLRADLGLSESKCAELTTNSFQLKQKIAEITSHNEEISSLLKEKDSELQIQIEQFTSMEKQHESLDENLRTNIDLLQKEKFEAGDQLESLRTQVVELKSKLQSNCEQEQLLQSQQDAHVEIIADHKAKLSKLMSENEHLQSLLDDSTALIQQKDQKLLGFEEILERTRSENNKLESTLSDVKITHQHELESLKLRHSDEVDFIESKCSKVQENCARLEQDIVKKQSDYDAMKEKFESKQSITDQLEEANNNLTKQVEILTKEGEHLKAELEKSRSSSTIPEENKVELESLQQSIKEKENYSAKLKVIAVKAKKELDAVKVQLQNVVDEKNQLQNRITELNNQLLESQARIMSGAQTMQVECDRLLDEIDQIKSEKSELVKTIEENKTQLSQLSSQKEEISAKLSAALMDSDRIRKEKVEADHALTASKAQISKLGKEIETLRNEKQSITQEVEAMKIQVTSFSKQLEEKQQQLTITEASLQQANQHIQQHDLMSLEMAQYEATLCGLQTQVSDLEVIVREKDEKVNELENKIVELNEDRRAIEELRVDAEDRVTRTKEALDSTRDQVARLSEVEHECKGQLDTVTEQYEFVQQQYEECKLNLASKASECQKLDDKIFSMQNLHQKSTELLERKLKQGQEDLNGVLKEQEALRSDYESYKIRVHSVLKQQKSREKQEQNDDGDAKISSMKSQLSQMHSKLVDTQSILASRDHELDLLQGDYDRLLRQQQQSSEGALERETRWKSRVKSLQQELLALRKQHDDVTLKLSQQDDVIAASVSKAMERSKAEHEEELEFVRAESKRKEEELVSLRSDLKKTEEKISASPKRVAPSPSSYRPHASLDSAVDYRSVARESGEGEEQPDDASVMSFEQILQTSRIHSVTEMPDDISVTSEMHVKQLETKLLAQTKQLEHSTEVARESEATALRLADQNKVLKEEIRRLEKNQEREKSVSNMEYLKNVVYKFLTLPPCDEKSHLIPVLDTMLRLSKEERATIEALASGGESEEAEPSGWGSYLQRWSGMQ